MSASNFTFQQVREDYRLLDHENVFIPQTIRLISHQNFTTIPGIEVENLAPSFFARLFSKISLVFNIFYSLQLLYHAKKNTVIIINGCNVYLLFCIGFFNQCVFFRRRTILVWDIFVEFSESKKRFLLFPFLSINKTSKEAVARYIMRGFDLIVLWSRKQVVLHADFYQLPLDKFIFLPFKSDHSKNLPIDKLELGDYIFSGGNSNRDYHCLTEAVRGTGIPVVISATNPEIRKKIGYLSNVIVVGAQEPAFTQLMASSRFVVLPMEKTKLRAAGEANFCNAMWHGKPIIASCSLSAEDYIINNETGFVVPSGDSQQLRHRIVELWNDKARCTEIGKQGRKHVLKYFTHEKFIRRLLHLALLLGEEKGAGRKTCDDD